MRAYGRGKVLALAVGVLAAAAACTGPAQKSPAPPTGKAAVTGSATPSPTGPAPVVTREEAAEAFSSILATDDVLRVQSDVPGRLGLAVELTRDGQFPLTQAAYQSTDNRPPRYTWGSPTFYVPRAPQQGQPPWFTALVTRNGQPTLLTFAKVEDWQLSSAAQLLPGQKAPQVRLDADGYASAVAPDDKSVTISPQYMGPVHASVAETGAAGVTAGLLADGPYTTDVAEQIATDREKAKKDGFSYDSIFSADNWPVYALRTDDGGALIQYSLSRNTSTRTVANNTYIIPVPPEAGWAISGSSVRRSLKLTEIHQYASAVPPLTAPAAARVIAHDGALTRAIGE
ncbi:hypothetical protein ACFFV7_10535 [Nonomuraea spiralis]|uniref:DUF8094 domain-containing protein n=1 Tax=Nonomuraea spiralis TaxID=46182 RepID=A0ABV5IAT2_9ACTN|nr:hypothetical protein [Nonomuraea spiralis]